MTISEIQKLETSRALSGTPVSQWCKEHNIGKNQYYYWRNKAKREMSKGEGNFLPMEIYGKGNSRPQSCSEMEVEMRTSTGTELRLRGFFSAEMISALIAASVEDTHV